MKCVAVVAAVCVATASADEVPGPIGKVLEMIGALEQKIIALGDESQKAYEEYAEFCEDRNKELSFEVKTGKANVEDLTSTIQKASADIDELDAKIGDLGGSLAKDSKELKEATAQRKKEGGAFATTEKDLVDTVDTLSRASGIIEREMAKGSSFAQLTGVKGLLTALNTLVQAQAIGSADSSKLTALLQSYSSSSDEDQDDATGAPAAAVTENKSGGILDALADLQSKAEDELAEARKEESNSQQNFDMKKQALSDEIKFATKDKGEAMKSKAATEEKKAAAEGELSTSSKDLMNDESANAQLHADCMSRATDFESETASSAEELKALATAKKIIKEATGAALDQVSFLQLSMDEQGMEAVRIVTNLGLVQRSKALGRLASRMESSLKRGGANPFGKVMGMINDMIAKLETEAEEEAGQKAFCDKSLAEANAKKDEATTTIDKLNVKMEQGHAKSTKLKEEVSVLQSELAKLMAAQQEMDRLRAEEKGIFDSSNAELKKGLTGIQTALKVLRDYYAANSDGGNAGAGGGIISLLEVCESDISKELADITATEEDAVAQYTAETKENELTKLTKDKDVEYKNKEIASLAKAGTEFKTDRDAVQEELDAVMQSLASLEKQCISKAESYGSKVAKQKAEIDGLKSALASLGGASLLQKGRSVRVERHSTSLRGA